MSEGDVLYQITSLNLTIPVWEVALYVGLTSVFMLLGRVKLCLVTSYLFTLYWGFILYWGQAMTSLATYPNLGTIYLVCGMLHVVLTMVAFMKGQ